MTSHHLSDHRLIICDLNIGRHKTATPICMARNIKAIGSADFECRLLNSQIFANPAVTTEEFLTQIEREVTVILDVVAPLCRARHHDITSDRKLSSEAVAAKKTKRHLERKWKKSQSDVDRVICRKAYSKANILINE